MALQATAYSDILLTVTLFWSIKRFPYTENPGYSDMFGRPNTVTVSGEACNPLCLRIPKMYSVGLKGLYVRGCEIFCHFIVKLGLTLDRGLIHFWVPETLWVNAMYSARR